MLSTRVNAFQKIRTRTAAMKMADLITSSPNECASTKANAFSLTLLDSSGRILGTSGQAALTALWDGVLLRSLNNAAWRIPPSPLRSSQVIRLANKRADIPDVRVPQAVMDVRLLLRGRLRDC